MIKFIAFAAFALALATSAQAMTRSVHRSHRWHDQRKSVTTATGSALR